jgi:hypothetical protein
VIDIDESASHKTAKDRFEKKFLVTPGCWLWQKGKRNGYGQFDLKGKTVSPHRASYEFYVGKIPDGLRVLHKCDNPPCVNPDHLFLGTDRDNVADCIKKGRAKRLRFLGGENGRAKLTQESALKIRADKRKLIEIAADYGVTSTTVCDIKAGRRWKHIDRF